jgi:hypothetical protein
MAATVTVAAPGDSYGNQVTLTEGQVLDIEPGGEWETAIGALNCPPLTGAELGSVQAGSSGSGTSN